MADLKLCRAVRVCPKRKQGVHELGETIHFVQGLLLVEFSKKPETVFKSVLLR